MLVRSFNQFILLVRSKQVFQAHKMETPNKIWDTALTYTEAIQTEQND